MPPIDCARWTTTLTASYLAITAALIAILGNAVPGQVGLVAVHLTLSGLLLILNRARPSAGILAKLRLKPPRRTRRLRFARGSVVFYPNTLGNACWGPRCAGRHLLRPRKLASSVTIAALEDV